VHSVVLHLRIKNSKVWIERDGMEEGIATDLLEAGIPKEDIVLAFYRPERRAITEFAVA
jgi:XisI protein